MHCLTPYFAAVIGTYLFIVFLAMLVNPQRARKALGEFVGDHALMYFSGGLSSLFGLIIVLAHNVWVSDWPVLITLIGWLLLLQGVCRLFCPDHFAKWTRDLSSGSGFAAWCWVWFLIGVYLMWMGYSAH